MKLFKRMFHMENQNVTYGASECYIWNNRMLHKIIENQYAIYEIRMLYMLHIETQNVISGKSVCCIWNQNVIYIY
jgi:hypothetical protein